jgi:hypothetical protein
MATYAIERAGDAALPRLVSSEKLEPADFDAIARDMAGRGLAGSVRARKVGFVAARPAAAPTRVVTRINGVETEADARPGDWIATNLDTAREILRDRDGTENSYIIRQDRFGELYERDAGSNAFGDIYWARGVVDAIAFPAGFDILAPWGERQVAASGHLVRNGADVYGVHADAFARTYTITP